MTAFIDIYTVSRNGRKNCKTFINDQVSRMSDAHAWFDMNMDYLKKQAKRKNVECVHVYVKEQYDYIYESTIQ